MALKHCFLGVFDGEPSGRWLVGLKFRVKVILAFPKRKQGSSRAFLSGFTAKSWRLND
jgi:hypothetical protein